MKIGIYSYHEIYNKNNAIFNSEMYKIGENLEYSIVKLKEYLNREGHSLDTLDIYPIKEYEKIIFLDLPDLGKIDLEGLIKEGKKLYLVILESQLIRPENMEIKNHKYFEKIFTWNDDLIELYGGKYVKLNVTHKIPQISTFKMPLKNKFCTIIAGNKKCSDNRELYSERVKAIEWFEKNCPNDLDLYGFGWNEYTFQGNKLIRIFNRFGFIRRIFAPKYKTYKGRITSKLEVLSEYKFSICYENARDLRGYITEKIFDCFFSGCVPVYWGASNIKEYIPEECFIDKKKFDTYEKLYKYLKEMSDSEYTRYLKNIHNFLISDEIKKFSGEYFSKKIINMMELKNE